MIFLDSSSRSAPNHSQLHDNRHKQMCLNYICKIQPRAGALSLDKCVKMGVPPGPLLGRLKGGEDITLPNGVVVKSSDVCEPDEPGPVFIGKFRIKCV